MRDSSKLSRAPSLLAAQPTAAKTSATDGGPPSNTGRLPRRRVARDADGRRGEVPQALRELQCGSITRDGLPLYFSCRRRQKMKAFLVIGDAPPRCKAADAEKWAATFCANYTSGGAIGTCAWIDFSAALDGDTAATRACLTFAVSTLKGVDHLILARQPDKRSPEAPPELAELFDVLEPSPSRSPGKLGLSVLSPDETRPDAVGARRLRRGLRRFVADLPVPVRSPGGAPRGTSSSRKLLKTRMKTTSSSSPSPTTTPSGC